MQFKKIYNKNNDNQKCYIAVKESLFIGLKKGKIRRYIIETHEDAKPN